ncbi:hypothetical protein SAMN02799636_04967 [Methylobacterium sp. 275MFSha3.1]|nr:hypothetical protein SAMN02799636_04967 [Methylobacterium sp. 275MFSha3.1]
MGPSMRQLTLCVPLEVKPESCSRLSALIENFKGREDASRTPETPNFARLKVQVPTLHFMSMSVFPGAEYDPIFIIEANIDGEPGPFWGQLHVVAGDMLQAMIRCCKRPSDGTGDLYDAATKGKASITAAAYLEARTQWPSVFHHGNRGLTRDRILEEHALFLALSEEVDRPAKGYHRLARAGACSELHAGLRRVLRPRFPWLDQAAPKRVTTREFLMDYIRFVRFLVLTLLGLSLPGVLLAPLLRWQLYLIVVGLGAVAVVALLWANRNAFVGKEVFNRVQLKIFDGQRLLLLMLGVLVYVALAVLILSPIIVFAHAFGVLAAILQLGPQISLWTAAHEVVRAVSLGLLSVFLTFPLLLLLVRWSEMRDSSQDAPPVADDTLREIVRREDWITQNHMGSIVLIKPGVLRATIIRLGHYGLGLMLRATARNGYLGNMRTVHFAHWAFLNNGSRLLFFSNFDHSWSSYLDDFIEKAHVGLTLAWGCGVGFPATRMLIYDGASHGRQFKAWALASRAVSRFWYSAYPNLTVDQIERNHRIANGLRLTTLSDKEAEAWLSEL